MLTRKTSDKLSPMQVYLFFLIFFFSLLFYNAVRRSGAPVLLFSSLTLLHTQHTIHFSPVAPTSEVALVFLDVLWEDGPFII